MSEVNIKNEENVKTAISKDPFINVIDTANNYHDEWLTIECINGIFKEKNKIETEYHKAIAAIKKYMKTNDNISNQKAPEISEIISRAYNTSVIVASSINSSPNSPSGNQAIVKTRTGQKLNIRTEAGMDKSIISSLENGTELEVLGTEGNWTHVKTKDGIDGYVWSESISKQGVQSSQTVLDNKLANTTNMTSYDDSSVNSPSGNQAIVKTRTGQKLNIRTEAGMDKSIISSLENGTELEVLGTEGNWTHVKTKDGLDGYVWSKSISKQSVQSSQTVLNNQTTSTGMTAMVTTNTKNLNLRQDPGISGSVITSIPQGTNIEILEPNKNGWTKVKYGDFQGYVSSNWITVNGNEE